MNKIQNEKPHFLPYDICKVIETNQLVIITEVSLNPSQTQDKHQWSYSVAFIEKAIPDSKIAWYSSSELELVNNIFKIITENSVCDRSNSHYKFPLENIRR